MRKTLVMSGAIAALFVGSIFVGVAVATTGAPVLYDARSPQPVATESGGFGVEAGEATSDPQVPADGADGDGDTPLPGTHSNPPVTSPSPAPSPSPSPAPGTPPADPVPTADEQQAWLAFQQLVRECMAGAEQGYRYWKWWNTEPRNPTSTAPAMPEGLSTEQEQAWRLALEGDGAGDDGCIGEATRADQQPPASGAPPPPAEDQAPPAESDAPRLENEAPPIG